MFQMHESKCRSGLQKEGVNIKTYEWFLQETIGCCLFALFGPAIVQLCTLSQQFYNSAHSSGYSTNFTMRTPETLSFFDLWKFAGFLRVFCGEFQVWCFPVFPISRPKAIILNSE